MVNGSQSITGTDGVHLDTARRVATRLIDEGAATAVIVHGSVALGNHRPDSDVDLLAVGGSTTGLERWDSGGLGVELITRTAAEWAGVLARSIPTWAYAWRDGVVMCDADGVGGTLRDTATKVLQDFRTPGSVLMEHREFWRHIRPKLAAVVSRGDPGEIGYAVSLSMGHMYESLFLLNDAVPPPASSADTYRRLMALDDPVGLAERLRRVVEGPDVSVRAEEKLALIDHLTAALGQKISQYSAR